MVIPLVPAVHAPAAVHPRPRTPPIHAIEIVAVPLMVKSPVQFITAIPHVVVAPEKVYVAVPVMETEV